MLDKILVAIDSSERNKSVFNSAVSLAQTTGASIMLLHIVSGENADDPVLPADDEYPSLNNRNDNRYHMRFAEYEQQGIEFLQSLTQEAMDVGIDVEYSQLRGNPQQMICKLASNWSADLIIVGSRQLKGWKEKFLGSVSNYVTHHAPCSVLIVRPEMGEAAALPEVEAIDRPQRLTDDRQAIAKKHRSDVA
ncbi:universal stress protein [Pleurocapsales cyanobacterium LEGE 10410]|nr:universal stress protein [Pleurocapsales cyanobacterium LEGE 10410]